jgi:hypothetical protein
MKPAAAVLSTRRSAAWQWSYDGTAFHCGLKLRAQMSLAPVCFALCCFTGQWVNQGQFVCFGGASAVPPLPPRWSLKQQGLKLGVHLGFAQPPSFKDLNFDFAILNLFEPSAL